MKNEIMTLLHSYKASAEHYGVRPVDDNPWCRITIETGTIEGYYVIVQKDGSEVSCRYHSRDEAVTALGVLLTMLPSN